MVDDYGMQMYIGNYTSPMDPMGNLLGSQRFSGYLEVSFSDVKLPVVLLGSGYRVSQLLIRILSINCLSSTSPQRNGLSNPSSPQLLQT